MTYIVLPISYDAWTIFSRLAGMYGLYYGV